MQATDEYLRAQIEAASPAQRQQMLIEAALRFGRQTLQLWRENRNDEAHESLQRCRQIATEIIGGVRTEAGELGRQVRSIYVFIFRTLTEAQHLRSEEKLNEALRVLEIERDTWAQFCARQVSAPPTATLPPTDSPIIGGGFSIEA